MGRWYSRIMQDFTNLTVTPRSCAASFWLNANDGVAEPHSGDQNFPVVNHCRRDFVFFLAGRFPPGFDHPVTGRFRQLLKPAKIFSRLKLIETASPRYDFLGCGPAEFRYGLFLQDRFDERFAVVGRFHFIAFPSHSQKQLSDTLQGIQVSTRSYRGL